MRTLKPILAVLALAASVAGCGQSEDRDQVRDVASRFAAAVMDRDGAAACELLSDATVEALEQQEDQPCDAAVLALRLDLGELTRSRVYVTNAQAVYASGEAAFLDRGADGWKLSAIGCRFEDGKPRSRPATCAAGS